MKLVIDAEAHAEEVAAIADRLVVLRERVAAACRRASRDEAGVTIIGVTKRKPASTVRAAAAAGITDVGENYAQELVAKHAELGAIARWHLIGHLQRNKVRAIAPLVAMVETIDSERLARELDREAGLLGRTIPVLLQVNTSGEPSKFGVAPADAPPLAAAIVSLRNLRLDGLMTIAAFLDDPEAVRPMFALLRATRDRLAAETGNALQHLSMGMTGDFEAAVEEGATMIRIGTALFGERG